MVIARNEAKPPQDRLLEINDWMGDEAIALRPMRWARPRRRSHSRCSVRESFVVGRHAAK